MTNILGKLLYGSFIIILLGISGLFLLTVLPPSLTGPLGQYEIKIVKSGSMEPAIPTGSIVMVRPSHTYNVGDVITFGKDTKAQIPTTHRILSTRTENGRTVFETKGDANEEADPVTVYESNVIGKVAFHMPYAGYVLDFARQPIGFTLMIGIPAAVIILDELIRIIQELAGLRRKKRATLRAKEDEHGSGSSMRPPEYFYVPRETKSAVDIRPFDIPRPDQYKQ